MKKLFLLSLMAVVLSFSTSAQRLVNANDARINNKAGAIKAFTQKVSNTSKYYQAPLAAPAQLSDLGKGLNRVVRPKAEADYEIFYVRPEATFEMAFDFDTYRGYPDNIIGPAFAPVTWKNRSDDGITATWMYYDMNSEEMQESEETDLVMTPAATDVGYWNYMPYLAVSEDDYYQDTLMIKYGGDATIIFNDYSQSSYPVAAFDVWNNLCCLDNYWTVYNYVDLVDEDSGDAAWTEELQDIYSADAENISNARVKGFVQFLGTPASPYIINNVRWLAYWIAPNVPKGFPVTLKVLGQDEDGQYTRLIAESSTRCEAHSQFTGAYLQFPLRTELEGGGSIEGAVIDGPAVLELTGFHEDGEENITRFMVTTEVMYSELMEKRLEFNSGVHLEFDYNNEGETERLTTFERATAGYYINDARDSVAYLHSYDIYFDLEYPFLYSADSKIEMPTEGGSKDLIVCANQISELWEVTDENGAFDLPEWVSIAFQDTYLDDSEIYNDTTNTVITVDALPEGVEGRQAKILLSYPSFDKPAVQKEFIITQGEVEPEPVEYNEFYLVGDFNEWNVAEDGGRFVFTESEDGIYEAKGAFLADSTQFKVITPDANGSQGYKWFGGIDETGVGYFLITDELLEQPLEMMDGSNFLLPKAGYYYFTVKQLPAGQLRSVTEPLVIEVRRLFGDVNCDGSVNAADVTALYNFILNGDETYLATSDVNGDGAVNAGDVTAVYNVILGTN